MSVLYFLHEGFKLKQNGINGKLLNLLKHYLANRKQRGFLNANESEWGQIESGVPQKVLYLDPYSF